ncbi:hypothetical protein Ddye_005246 [Dipteronia dyeriana]|uniref:DUF1985 domain-containing protein n=1 Tax=Dipteronia dyeriana TaxID=168575 RepID=A0AAD9XG38_9ROSI|nr:hypothetical protein Ddye_005246 [Dipteronia dyeriana]
MRNRLRDLLKTPQGDWYEGKLTRHDHFDALAHIDDALNRVYTEFTDKDQRRFMASCFGYFLTIHQEMKFSGGVIHQLPLRELHHNGPIDKMQFMLGNQSVRFSKMEFYLITELRFGVVPDTTKYAEVENDIHQRYFPRADKISLEEIRGVVTIIEFGEVYDAVKLCLIYMLNWILMGLDGRFKIPVWQFRLVKDLDAFDAFPWDAHVYRHSIYSFRHALDGQRGGFERFQQEKGTHIHTVETYNIYSLSYTILIFTFEVIPDSGQEFGTRRVTDLSPCILKWELTKQPKGKKLAKIFKAWMFAKKELVPTPVERQAPYYTGINERGSLYVEEEKIHIPPPVSDQTEFGGNSGTEGMGLIYRTSDKEGSEHDAGGLRPNDSEGYQTDPQRERHRHRRVWFTTPKHGTSTGDSRGGVGRDGEKSDENLQQQHRVLLDTIRGLQGSTIHTHREVPPPSDPDFSPGDRTNRYTEGIDRTGGLSEDPPIGGRSGESSSVVY